jgi:hypothetical protein
MNPHNIKIKTYKTRTGDYLTSRSSTKQVLIKQLSTCDFTDALKKSYSVNKWMKDKIIAILMGFHPRLGANSSLKNTLSKDVVRWMVQNYINLEDQLTVLRMSPKVWTVNELIENLSTNFIDIIVSNVKGNIHLYKFISPRFVDRSLNITPIVIQTPSVLMTGNYDLNVHNNSDIRTFCKFNPKYKSYSQFKELFNILDTLIADWVFLMQREIFGGRSLLNRLQAQSCIKSSLIPLNDGTGIYMNFRIEKEKPPIVFDENARRIDSDKFFQRLRVSGNSKWVKLIMYLEDVLIDVRHVNTTENKTVCPRWKILQIRKVKPPKRRMDYMILDEDE